MVKERISDVESKLVAKLSLDLKPEYESINAMWLESPFAWIKSRPARQVGAIGERLVENWCKEKGFIVERTGDSDADRVIQGYRVEVKFSTLWTDNGIYKFQQIRNQNYDFCFCLGVSPFDVHAWFIPKSKISSPRPPALTHQHGGSEGRDTMWLSFTAANPPEWMNEFGGNLQRVESLISNLI